MEEEGDAVDSVGLRFLKKFIGPLRMSVRVRIYTTTFFNFMRGMKKIDVLKVFSTQHPATLALERRRFLPTILTGIPKPSFSVLPWGLDPGLPPEQ
jgi:hypothetical protein